MIKLIKQCIREYKWYAIVTPIFMTLEVICEILIPYLMIDIVDGLKHANNAELLKSSGILLLVAGLALVFGYSSGKIGAIASTGFGKNLREDVYSNILKFSFEDTDKFSSSSLVTRLTTDITNIQNSFAMILRIVVRVPLMIIFALVLSFIINAKMALVFVVVFPILGLIFGLIIRKAFPLFDRIFSKYDKFNNNIQENIKGIRVVKSFVKEDYEINKFDDSAKVIRDDFTKAEKIIALNSPVATFAIVVVQVLLFTLGSILIVRTFGGYDASGMPIWGELSTGDLQSLLTYSMQILMNLMMLCMIIVMLTISRTNVRRVSEVINAVPSMEVEKTGLNVEKYDLEFKNVCFKYSESATKNTLENINLKINEGESVGIIGGTGSSKTTFISLIPRLYDVTSGSIMIGEHDVKEYNLVNLRDNIGIVLQKNVLFSGTILENLRWGKEDATLDEVKECCQIACILDFIESLPEGFDTLITQGGTNVSGGQKQRLCIARALLKSPKILILDDSTSAVDTKTDLSIKNALNNSLNKTTKIIISQRISSIETCDKIIVLEDGKINGLGTHQELIKTNAIYQEIYEVQQQNKRSDLDNETNE